MASTSTTNSGSFRRRPGSSDGVTGRSFTTVSSPLPCTRRPRTTTPFVLNDSSGVSKKYTCRICESSASISSAAMVA